MGVDPHGLRGHDRGAAMLLAVGALAIVALLGAALLENARREVHQAARLVDRAATDSMTDIAVATAWGEIVGGATDAFSDSGATAAGRWSFVATPADSRRWTILVEAGTGIDAVTGKVTIARDALLPYTLLIDTAATGPLTGLVEGRVGIQESAKFSGRSLGDVQELIGATAACAGCSNPVTVEFGATGPAVPASLPPQPCPDTGGTITGTLAGATTYVCHKPGPLVFTGAVSVKGPVVFDLGPDVELYLKGADLNTAGDPSDLVISQPTSNGPTVEIAESSLRGILQIPESRLSTAGFRWVGMVVAEDLTAAVGSELSGVWAVELEAYGFAGWRVTSWETSRD